MTLTLNAVDATGMIISNNQDFSGAEWESYTALKENWWLTSGDGTKTVYFKAKDNAVPYPNIALPVNDTIILDTTPPTITIVTPENGSSTTTHTNLTIRANLYDATSGVNTSSVTIIFNGTDKTMDNNTIINPNLVMYQAPSLTDGTYNVSIIVKDMAGNIAYKNWSFTVTTEEEETGEETEGGTTGQPTTQPVVDNPPVISNVQHSPTTVTDADMVTITATVTDDNAIKTVTLFWNNSMDSKEMSKQTGDVYSATIGPFPGGTKVTYYIMATDSSSQTTTSSTYSFTVQGQTTPSPPSEEEKPVTINLTIDIIAVGEIKNISLKEYETALEEIKIIAADNLTDVKVNIEKLTEKPADVAKPSEKVYAYISIETNAEQEDISSIIVSFKVEKTWIEENNIDKETIILLRYHNNEWQKLSTAIKNESVEYVYYEAEVPGLSMFAIVGSTLTTQPPLEPLTTVYFTQPLIIYVIIIGAVAVSLTVVFLLYYRKHS
ncbi:MAG TPA: PGF-pre-PGF domain-containing protein [Thermoplasmatales archaeon]|nr:PGF-pre-PGF domain-containing protein [Thermoplasmatales archaeon]